jgi:hypothetical protein
MMKIFFCHTLESGIRFNTAARGYESRNEVMSLTEAISHGSYGRGGVEVHLRSSMEAPVAFESDTKADKDGKSVHDARLRGCEAGRTEVYKR